MSSLNGAAADLADLSSQGYEPWLFQTMLNELSVSELGIEMVMCGGEPGAGLKDVRARIETAYGAKLYDNSGAVHTFHGVGCNSPEQMMHLVSEDYCVLELLDPETKSVVELRDGATGEMVFTYLDIEGTPFLRYSLGDVLQVFTSPCGCGRPGLRFKILSGDDQIWLDNSSGKTVIIKLRPNVVFHDGEKFDAEAAKYSLERQMTMQGSFRRPELGSVASIEAVDPLTIKLNLKAPFSPLIAQLTDRAGMMVSPAAIKASRTGSVLNGLIMASIFFTAAN